MYGINTSAGEVMEGSKPPVSGGGGLVTNTPRMKLFLVDTAHVSVRRLGIREQADCWNEFLGAIR